jgi:hypothetical protein
MKASWSGLKWISIDLRVGRKTRGCQDGRRKMTELTNAGLGVIIPTSDNPSTVRFATTTYSYGSSSLRLA